MAEIIRVNLRGPPGVPFPVQLAQSVVRRRKLNLDAVVQAVDNLLGPTPPGVMSMNQIAGPVDVSLILGIAAIFVQPLGQI